MGRAYWLEVEEDAQSRLEEVAREWGLEWGEAFPDASCAVVRRTKDREGNRLVLKSSYLLEDGRASARAAGAFQGFGGASILRFDHDRAVQLMPMVEPGENLAQAGIQDPEAVDICADLILSLRRAEIPDGTPRLETWFEELTPDDPLVHEARSVADRLFATAPEPVLLHGDLHHFNILRLGQGWISIDPAGVAGDPAFEISGFMRNPLGTRLSPERMALRIRRFAERLGDPMDRLWGWSFAQTVLSHVWSSSPGSTADWRQAAEAILACRTML